jgi:hypothetical protein
VDFKLRIVTQLPLRELWRDDGFRTTARGRSLTDGDIRALLTSGPIQFVIADVGATLRWIPASESLRFWKDEAKPHLASQAQAHLAEFPDGYCYFASQWEAELGTPIVVLEKHH